MGRGIDRWLHLLSPPATRVWVASRMPDKLAGVRDGFDRALDELLPDDSVRVVVTPCAGEAASVSLPLTDAAILDQAVVRARALDRRSEEGFAIATEAGLVSIRAGGQRRVVLRTWAVVRAMGEEAWGAGGSVQVPVAVLEGADSDAVPAEPMVSATRRHGGLVADLTGGHETRRSATALATYLALVRLVRVEKV